MSGYKVFEKMHKIENITQSRSTVLNPLKVNAVEINYIVFRDFQRFQSRVLRLAPFSKHLNGLKNRIFITLFINRKKHLFLFEKLKKRNLAEIEKKDVRVV